VTQTLPPAASLWLRTVDGVRLCAEHLPPGPQAAPGVAVVLAHGFTGAYDRPAVRAISARLAGRAGVIAFDFRGHGRSQGESTLGDAEVLDVDAAVAAARDLGYRKVATLGFSMGGACVLRHAALVGARTAHPVDAVATVGAVSRWYRTETGPMRRLHWAVQTRLGRQVARWGLRTRVSPQRWIDPPVPPDELVDRIAPVPLLIVHGEQDAYLDLSNARDLYAAATEPKELWVWPGFGHAESAMTPAHTDLVAGWLCAATSEQVSQ